MSIETLKKALPDYAKDIKLNLSSLVNDESLNEQQLWGTFLVSAFAGRNEFVIQQICAGAAEYLSPEVMTAAKAAAAIMAMNNVYYRFVHLVSNKDYQTMQAKLRMNVIANPGVEKDDFELWSLAVSVINGCGMCIDAHEQQLLKHGVSKEQIQTAARIASVTHAVAAILDGEQAMGSDALSQAA
ncbi:MAG: carboxymuconolactone decarboxylase family protein [Alphaproteobacteria bacterium]|nr:carboxymuconolactone decarboxylase family protein [Alphaproteobacteria bacterium]